MSTEDSRRQLTLLHARFYCAFFVSMFVLYASHEGRLTGFVVLILYSFWVPQIALNVVTEARRPLHLHYIVGMSVTRVMFPLYLFGYSNNFVAVAFPSFKPNYGLCAMLVLWVGAQTAVLILQMKRGTRFFIPAKFLPPKFDYSRPLPPSLLAQTNEGQDGTAQASSSSSSSSSSSNGGIDGDLEMGTVHSRAATIAQVTPSNPSTAVRDGSAQGGTLDCVICYCPIDTGDRKSYMLAPCEVSMEEEKKNVSLQQHLTRPPPPQHIFHKDCLVQWMDVKMECPTCRGALPAI